VAAAVASAVQYVGTYTALTARGLPVPDDALTESGLVGFATRMFLDQYAPMGSSSAFGDPSFPPVFTPEDVYAHWHHYFDHLDGYVEATDEVPASGGWGIA
jgi:hypothetical protein